LACTRDVTPEGWPRVEGEQAQPLAVHVERLTEALNYLGSPLSEETLRDLRLALLEEREVDVVAGVQQALDPYCLVSVSINPESQVKVTLGPATPELAEQGWRIFLVKVTNAAGATSRLNVSSPQAQALPGAAPEQIRDRWLELDLFENRPLQRDLSGIELEYRVLQVHSRDAGKRSAVLSFDIGQGPQQLGFKNDVVVTFDCLPSTPVTLVVKDEHGQPTTAGFVFRDEVGRIYPSPAKRLAPDFFFHPQVYRADGEEILLPPGIYNVDYGRGPEYLKDYQHVSISTKPATLTFELERWIDPSTSGWWSGDHHIHAAGCMHYTDPTQGVLPEDMFRHMLGEDLKIGAALTWGPCFDYQKQFFTGRVDEASTYPYLLRYDIEVSGFGSHESGHLCLLRLKEQIYPGGESTDHWPTLGLNTLRWAQAQGAVCGPAHSGWGLKLSTNELPTREVPPFNGIGANEYIVDVTHEVPGPDGVLVPAVDFMSLMDTPPTWELNIWYHTLNCGFRTRASGETDFPCIYGERVGLGRSYVQLDEELDYDAWCTGIEQGRSYTSDGYSHLMNFRIDDAALGVDASELRLDAPRTVRATVTAAALLPETRDLLAFKHLPHWNLERARIEDTRDVQVECVVNGVAVDRQVLTADGQQRELAFDVPIERSSWVALRVLPSSHTNPIFVLVDDQPIRASRHSASWCLEAVERCWSQKERFYDADERADAGAAYDHARRTYARILAECEVD